MTYEQAESIISQAFGDDAHIPPICYAGEVIAEGTALAYDPEKVEYCLDGDDLKIIDRPNETIWAIDLRTGQAWHSGMGEGCFFAGGEQWFTPKRI